MNFTLPRSLEISKSSFEGEVWTDSSQLMKELFVGIRIVRNLFVSDIKAFFFFIPGAFFFLLKEVFVKFVH